MALDGYRELINELASQPPLLKEAAESAGDPPPGEWGAAEILAHLAATEELFLSKRLRPMMAETTPRLRLFGDPENERMNELRNRSWEENLETFGDSRGEIVSMLMSMTTGDWERSGIHDTEGEITIEQVIETILDHDTEHLNQLRALSG